MTNSRIAGMNASAQSEAGMWSGLGSLAGSLGAAWIMASDVRLKMNLVKIGDLMEGVGVYEFNYIDDADTWYTGVLADELEEVMPHLVGEFGGFKTVNYKGLIEEVAHG